MFLIRAHSASPPSSVSTSESVPVLNHKEVARGLTIIFTLIAWACSLLRLYTRFFIIKSPWWDDLFIVLSLLSSTAGSIIYCILPNYGLGARHMSAMTTDEINAFLKVFYVGSVTYPFSLTVIKLAVLFQYLRVFKPGSRRRTASKILILVIAIWGLVYTFLTWVPCAPPSDMWNIAKPGRHCWAFASPYISEALGFYISHSVTTTVLDFVVFLLPMHLFFQADTQKNTRIALLCLFGLGLVVNLCSIGRLIYSLTPTLNSIGDLSWNSPTPTGLAVIEINLAAVCAALPIFWPVLKEKWGRILVTYEVRVTSEDGNVQKIKMTESPRMVSHSSERAHWDPYSTYTKTMQGHVEKTGENPSETSIKVDLKETSFLA